MRRLQGMQPYVLSLLSLLFGVLFIRHAWVAEDAYITFRTVANIVAGYGPVWNTAERVQAFTHPLWMLLHVPLAFLPLNIYTITVALSALCSFCGFCAVAAHRSVARCAARNVYRINLTWFQSVYGF